MSEEMPLSSGRGTDSGRAGLNIAKRCNLRADSGGSMTAAALKAPLGDDDIMGTVVNQSDWIFQTPPAVRRALKRWRVLCGKKEDWLESFAVLAAALPEQCIRASTRDEYLAYLRQGIHDHERALEAFIYINERVSGSLGSSEAESDDLSKVELINIVVRIAGADAEHEVVFALETYDRACRLAEALHAGQPRELESDLRLAKAFEHSSRLFNFGQTAILYLDLEVQPSAAAIATSFEVLRAGALRAYDSASEATRLRRQDDPVVDEMLPWDDDDARLARY